MTTPPLGSHPKIPFQVRAASRNIHLVDLTCTSRAEEWWFLLSGDRHHDNPHADHDLERTHLDQAIERRAGIIDVGDLHCSRPELDEAAVDATARDISRLLWRVGYRRNL